jgi:DHA1 family multidrug resistance protein-like MFS transporter
MTAPGWRRNVVAMTAASFTGFMGFTLVMPFLPVYFGELGVADPGMIALWSGLSLAVTPALTALCAPFWGRLADRVGHKIMVERSLASFVVVMGATAFVTSAWQVLALRTVQGFFAGYGALTITMAAASAPRDRMAAAIGGVQAAQRLGPAVGPLIGGLLAPLVGLRRAFLVVAGIYAVALGVVSVLYREPLAGAGPADGPRERISFRRVLAFDNFVPLMVALFGLQFVDRSFGPVLPLFVAETGTAVDRVVLVSGILFSLMAGSAAVGHNLGARLLARRPARVTLERSSLLAGAAALAFGLSPGLVWMLAASAGLGVGIGIAMTAVYAAAGRTIPASARGAGFGLLTTASLTGLAVSPLISGLVGAGSLRAVFVLDAAALFVLARLVPKAMVDPATNYP